MSHLLTRKSFFSVVVLFTMLALAGSVGAQSANLIPNGSFETSSGSVPQGWVSSYWGSPVPTFVYPAVGNAGTKGATVTLASNSTGDAAWRLATPINVTPGSKYTYTTWYNSNVASEIDAEYISSSGATSYAWLGNVPSSGGVWKQISLQFTVPSGMTKASVYQLIYRKGTLTLDDTSLVSASGVTPTPTVTLSASPTVITAGQSSTLTWSSTNTTSCTTANNWNNSTATSGTGSVAPTVTTTYTITCTGAGGSVSQSTTVTVSTATPQPTVTLTATPSSITNGQSSTLTWNSTNATNCTATGGWSGTKSTSGSGTVTPSATATYTLSCTGAGGSASQSVVINVSAAAATPTLTLSASPTAITSGQSSTLSWNTTNVTSCVATGAWSGSKSVSGSSTVAPTTNSTYTLTCTGTGGSVSKSASITVTPISTNPNQFPEGMVTLTFDDAWSSQYTNAVPILNASGMKGTFYMLSSVIQGSWQDYMTPPMAQAIANAGHEIAGHTITHPNLTALSSSQITNEITVSRTYLQNLTGKSITSIAYPYGSVNTTVKNLTSQAGYTSGRGVDDSQLNTPKSDKFNLFAQCVEKTDTLASIKAQIDKAKANKTWYILCFHDVKTNGDQYSVTPTYLQQIIDYIKQVGIKTVTVQQGRTLMAN